MRKIKITGLTIALTTLSFACMAQEEDGPLAYTYASYFYCSGDLSVVDDMITEDADRMNGLVEDGTIMGWGWLEHHTGGRWSRAFYYQHESIEGLFAAGEAVADVPDDEDDDSPGFGEICWDHQDYIWQVDNGSNSEERGPVGFSVYFDCDITREERAGDIVDEHVAPILNGYVEDGKLASWGWSTHLVGGDVRALQTMTAADLPTLLASRAQSIEDIYSEDSEAGAEFADICGSHSDYIWNINVET